MTSAKSITKRIEAANAGRDPDRLRIKFDEMQHDPFAFLRGTCQIFYEDLEHEALPKAPLVWCCGDLHLKNFGAYKGENRLVYFDYNDFDEACLAPATWDLVRMLASVVVAGRTVSMDRRTIDSLTKTFLGGYCDALIRGKALWVERATSTGWIRALLVRLKKRSRKRFLIGRTALMRSRRSLVIDSSHTLPLGKGQAAMLRGFLEEFAETQPNPAFYRYIDAARRIAGTGSLGLDRFVILVEGRGSPDGNFLLDLKYQPGPAVVPRHGVRQPEWESEAHRVVGVQHMVQAVTPALLHAVSMDGRAFVLRELMPTKDRLDAMQWRRDTEGFHEAVRKLGQLVAWGNLRSASRRGSALADEIIGFGQSKNWVKPLLECASLAADRTEKQWREFAGA